MGGVYSGAFGYADELKLLTHTVQALHILTNICIEYAAKYDILFNGKKSLLMIYKCTKNFLLIQLSQLMMCRYHRSMR